MRKCRESLWPTLHQRNLPVSLSQSWDIFFRNANAGAPPGTAYQSPPPLGVSLSGLPQVQTLVSAQPNVEKLVEDHLAVQSLIRAYQVRPARSAGRSPELQHHFVLQCHVDIIIGDVASVVFMS